MISAFCIPLLACGIALGGFHSIDMDIIEIIESKGNAKAVSTVGNHRVDRGAFQISPGVLKEFNRYHKARIEPKDLFTYRTNKSIALWYMNIRIPEMLRYYNKPVTKRNLLVSYNAGISYVVKGKSLPRTTRLYLLKYSSLKLHSNIVSFFEFILRASCLGLS